MTDLENILTQLNNPDNDDIITVVKRLLAIKKTKFTGCIESHFYYGRINSTKTNFTELISKAATGK